MTKSLIVAILIIPFTAHSQIEEGGWTQTNFGVGYPAFFANGPGKILYCAFSNFITYGIATSYDNGLTGGDFRPVSFTVTALVADSTALFVGTDNGLYRSTDTAKSWTLVTKGLPQEKVGSLVMCTGVIIASMQSGIYASKNGEDWTLQNSSFSSAPLIVHSSTIYMNFAGLFVSTDTGRIWAHVDSIHHFHSIAPSDNWLFGSEDGIGISRSSDGGRTWERTVLPEEDPLFTLVTYHNDVFASQVGGEITGTYLSSDAGNKWSKVNGGQPHRLFDLLVSGPNLLAASWNVGLWYRPLADIFQSLSVNTSEDRGQLTLYPNPFHDRITLSLPAAASDVTVSIVDLMGREVYSTHTSNAREPLCWTPNGAVIPGRYLCIARMNHEARRILPIIKE